LKTVGIRPRAGLEVAMSDWQSVPLSSLLEKGRGISYGIA
jgi:hypothetical protein